MSHDKRRVFTKNMLSRDICAALLLSVNLTLIICCLVLILKTSLNNGHQNHMKLHSYHTESEKPTAQDGYLLYDF